MPLRGRRSGPKYQVSTERETLTTSEDDSIAANNATPYIRITEPQSGRMSLVVFAESANAMSCLENESSLLIDVPFVQEGNLEVRQTKGSFHLRTTKPLLRLRQKRRKRRKKKRKKKRKRRIHLLPLSSGFYSKRSIHQVLCCRKGNLVRKVAAFVFSQTVLPIALDGLNILFWSCNKFPRFKNPFNVIRVGERELSLVLRLVLARLSCRHLLLLQCFSPPKAVVAIRRSLLQP